MVKLFNDNATNLECFLWAATFLGVLYLVYINQPMRINTKWFKPHITKSEKFEVNNNLLRFETVSDSQTHRGWNNY
jgi:hypothetical protein